MNISVALVSKGIAWSTLWPARLSGKTMLEAAIKHAKTPGNRSLGVHTLGSIL